MRKAVIEVTRFDDGRLRLAISGDDIVHTVIDLEDEQAEAFIRGCKRREPLHSEGPFR